MPRVSLHAIIYAVPIMLRRYLFKMKLKAVFYAILAALLYAINMPFSKLLLNNIPSTMLAGFLYLGAGIGIGIMFLFRRKSFCREEMLTKQDLPYTIGMIVLDILAPVLLMYGLEHTTSATASLLNNFEIVATALIALLVFKEFVSKRLWLAIACVTLSSIILSVEDFSSLKLSWGSVFVLLAAICWGFENNLTRSISSKNTYEIVMLKGIFSGLGSLVIALILGEKVSSLLYIVFALILGFFAYGLSIFFYIRAQKELGAAKTSAYYAIAPFVGAFLSFIFLKETLTVRYVIALIIMIVGSLLTTSDTLKHSNTDDC